MRSLRQQVDRIDLKMLQLLQQRTKLSCQIGQMKRQHGAVVYVPERERELVAHLTRASKGEPPAHVVAAIYREIMSSSRAAQGQMPVGFLRSSKAGILAVARSSFGACDVFLPHKNWSAIAEGLKGGALSFALLTGADLLGALQTAKRRAEFVQQFTIEGSCVAPAGTKPSLASRVFIVAPQGEAVVARVDRILILIECKSTVNAIKSLLHSMSDSSFSAQHLVLPGSSGRSRIVLAELSSARMADESDAGRQVIVAAQSTGMTLSILGAYPGAEDHGG
jgi:chorismate mutase